MYEEMEGSLPAYSDPSEASPVDSVTYSPVRIDKFVLLSVLTYGAYEIVWFFRNWRYVRDATGAEIRPWARALFAPLWYHRLLQTLGVPRVALLAASYLLITATWRLPDPWWLVSSLSVLSLVPAVATINRLNGKGARFAPTYGWRRRSIVVATLGALALPISYAGAVGPSTALVAGAEMRGSHVEYLATVGMLAPDEEVLFFYSSGFWSIRGGGVFASNLGVTSYWIDPVSEELTVAFLAYGQIADVETNPSTTWFEDTIVRLTNDEGDWMAFTVSAEGGGDAIFLEEIERRMVAARRQLITA
jgi:hypothetical protein